MDEDRRMDGIRDPLEVLRLSQKYKWLMMMSEDVFGRHLITEYHSFQDTLNRADDETFSQIQKIFERMETAADLLAARMHTTPSLLHQVSLGGVRAVLATSPWDRFLLWHDRRQRRKLETRYHIRKQEIHEE